MSKQSISRRQFIHSSGVVMVGTSAILAGCGGGSTPEPTPPPPSPTPTPTPSPTPSPTPPPVDNGEISITPQNKSLVFIMLDGGNDSFNMLVPTTQSQPITTIKTVAATLPLTVQNYCHYSILKMTTVKTLDFIQAFQK